MVLLKQKVAWEVRGYRTDSFAKTIVCLICGATPLSYCHHLPQLELSTGFTIGITEGAFESFCAEGVRWARDFQGERLARHHMLNRFEEIIIRILTRIQPIFTRMLPNISMFAWRMSFSDNHWPSGNHHHHSLSSSSSSAWRDDDDNVVNSGTFLLIRTDGGHLTSWPDYQWTYHAHWTGMSQDKW